MNTHDFPYVECRLFQQTFDISIKELVSYANEKQLEIDNQLRQKFIEYSKALATAKIWQVRLTQ